MLKLFSVRLLMAAVALAASAQSTPQMAPAHPQKSIRGAVATVQLDNGTAKVTILNQSQHDITGFSVGLHCKLENGSVEFAGRSEDYGPAAITDKVLHHGESVTEVMNCPPTTQSATAEVLVAFYDDQTAEVKDDQTFRETLAVREGIAKSLQLEADVLKKSTSDATPHLRAQRELQSLVQAHGDDRSKSAFFQQEIENIKRAPAGREQEFVQGEADRLQHQAVLWAQYANIRRLP